LERTRKVTAGPRTLRDTEKKKREGETERERDNKEKTRERRERLTECQYAVSVSVMSKTVAAVSHEHNLLSNKKIHFFRRSQLQYHNTTVKTADH